MTDLGTPSGTEDAAYTARLLRAESAWWKRLVDVRGVYGWNLRRLRPGLMLDVGCGLGRNLAFVGGHGVGVDHNAASVAECRRRGFVAFLPDEFRASEHAQPGGFDSLLLAHVLEHLPEDDGRRLVSDYLPFVRKGGRVIVITPQELGYRSDPTHVRWLDPDAHRQLLGALGVHVLHQRSFPLPHAPFGRLFRHNEFVTVGQLP